MTDPKDPSDTDEVAGQPNPDAAANPSKFELIVDLIRDRFWSLIAVGFAAGAVGLYAGFEPEIPRFWKIALAAGIAMLPVGFVAGNKVIDLLYNPSWIYLVDLAAAEETGALHRFSEADFRDLEVTDGQLDRLAPGLYVGKSVDQELMTVDGTWRGTLTDRELLLSLRKVRECRGQLEDDARRGFVLRSSAFTIVRRAVRETTKSVVATFERGTLPDDGEAMTNAIDAELEEFGISDDLDETIEDLAAERKERSDKEKQENETESMFTGDPDENGAPKPEAD